jgi:hypothetical protein
VQVGFLLSGYFNSDSSRDKAGQPMPPNPAQIPQVVQSEVVGLKICGRLRCMSESERSPDLLQCGPAHCLLSLRLVQDFQKSVQKGSFAYKVSCSVYIGGYMPFSGMVPAFGS